MNTSSSTSLLVEWSESSVTTTDLVMYQVIFREEFDNGSMITTILGQTNLRNRYVLRVDFTTRRVATLLIGEVVVKNVLIFVRQL